MIDGTRKPRWLRDLSRFLPLKSQFVLSGNVADLQVFEIEAGTAAPASLEATICQELTWIGYAGCLVYDPVTGFREAEFASGPSSASRIFDELGLRRSEGTAPAGLAPLADAVDRIVRYPNEPICLIVAFGSRLTIRPDVLSESEHWLFTRALVLSREVSARPAGPQRDPFFNTVIWIVNNETDLPDWFLIDNPRIRHIPISLPDHHARRALIPSLLGSLPSAEGTSDEAIRTAEMTFVEETEGLRLADMNAIVQLARREDVPIARISDAIRRYKVGVTDDPYRSGRCPSR